MSRRKALSLILATFILLASFATWSYRHYSSLQCARIQMVVYAPGLTLLWRPASAWSLATTSAQVSLHDYLALPPQVSSGLIHLPWWLLAAIWFLLSALLLYLTRKRRGPRQGFQLTPTCSVSTPNNSRS